MTVRTFPMNLKLLPGNPVKRSIEMQNEIIRTIGVVVMKSMPESIGIPGSTLSKRNVETIVPDDRKHTVRKYNASDSNGIPVVIAIRVKSPAAA
jgi:hypothetical protein